MKKGIDVSSHNGNINWGLVKIQIDFAIIRIGYGDNITSQDDKQFLNNVNGCIHNGIPFGFYIYSYAKTNAQVQSEIEHTLRLISPYKNQMSYPIYYDLEESGTENGAKERAIQFGNALESYGYSVGIYASRSWWNNYLNGLDRFTKWVADYGKNDGVPHTKPNVNGTDIWQYTSVGTIAGINSKVDINYSYRDFVKATPQVQPTQVQQLIPTWRAVKVSSYYKNPNDTIDKAIINNAQGIITEMMIGALNPYHIAELGIWVNDGDIREDISQQIIAMANKPKERIYIVQSGDTLGKIAQKFGTSYQKIANDNGISNPNKIYIGQRLVIR